MKIDLLHLKQGAQQACGLVVVIDVFRAFSTACYVFSNGATKIIPVGSIEEAFKMKDRFPGSILIGERNEQKCEGFDYGNSPTHIEHVGFTGKTVVQTTSAGTQGLVLAEQAEQIVTGSFVNAGAIVQYIKMQKPNTVSLVCMGYNGERQSQEDNFCALWIRNTLLGKPSNFPAMVEELRKGDGARLLDPANHKHSPASDFDLCLKLNHFDFILKAHWNMEGYLELKKFVC